MKMKLLLLWCSILSVTLFAQQDEGKKKREMCERFVSHATAYLKNHSIAHACAHFVHDDAWRRGEIMLFLFDDAGTCYCFGNEYTQIGSPFAQFEDAGGRPLMEVLRMVSARGGWVEFLHNNGYLSAYVQSVHTQGKEFILGAGYYPDSYHELVENLVRRTAEYLRDNGTEKTFLLVSNPYGFLVRGYLHVTIIGEDGLVYADGSRKYLGQNIRTHFFTPSAITEKLVQFIESAHAEHWFEFLRDNVPYHLYVQRYHDVYNNKEYCILSGYYAGMQNEAVNVLTGKVTGEILSKSLSEALEEFNGPKNPAVLGDLKLFVYTPEGLCLADGENPGFIGQILLDRQDDVGESYMKELIAGVLAEGSSWATYHARNAYRSLYGEKLVLADGSVYIVGVGHWPLSKEHRVMSMSLRAASIVKSRGIFAPCELFSQEGTSFVQGDSHIALYTAEGVCLANGPYERAEVWDAVIKPREKKYRAHLAAVARKGGGWTNFRRKQGNFRAYVQPLTVGSERLMVVSGFYI